ncbi:hypothetical protein SteCoe_9017 [Stentor coeruleus]|uniref:PX domain-containing protein n=1 Tax=Stentor coeruleus TaxID=5963 RepID=A0A1R2CIT9_9CILI|nr:hypothetical protein SteCoe_9017 [Stentor coeruleus]
MSLSIKVKDYEVKGEHIEYIIEVLDKLTGESWKFFRRYSTLRDIHKQLKSLDNKVPEFPPKKIFGSKNPRFLAQRKGELDVYFTEIVKLSSLMQNTFTKDFLKPKDAIMLKTSPSVPTVPYKKPKQGPEIQNFVNQLNDVVSAKFFDLSSQPAPAEEDEVKRQMKIFEGFAKNLKIADNSRIPEGSHINGDYFKSTVVKQGWARRAFKDLNNIVKKADTPALIISF